MIKDAVKRIRKRKKRWRTVITKNEVPVKVPAQRKPEYALFWLLLIMLGALFAYGLSISGVRENKVTVQPMDLVEPVHKISVIPAAPKEKRQHTKPKRKPVVQKVQKSRTCETRFGMKGEYVVCG